MCFISQKIFKLLLLCSDCQKRTKCAILQSFSAKTAQMKVTIAQFSQVLVVHPHFGHFHGCGGFLYLLLFFLVYFTNKVVFCICIFFSVWVYYLLVIYFFICVSCFFPCHIFCFPFSKPTHGIPKEKQFVNIKINLFETEVR